MAKIASLIFLLIVILTSIFVVKAKHDLSVREYAENQAYRAIVEDKIRVASDDAINANYNSKAALTESISASKQAQYALENSLERYERDAYCVASSDGEMVNLKCKKS